MADTVGRGFLLKKAEKADVTPLDEGLMFPSAAHSKLKSRFAQQNDLAAWENLARPQDALSPTRC